MASQREEGDEQGRSCVWPQLLRASHAWCSHATQLSACASPNSSDCQRLQYASGSRSSSTFFDSLFFSSQVHPVPLSWWLRCVRRAGCSRRISVIHSETNASVRLESTSSRGLHHTRRSSIAGWMRTTVRRLKHVLQSEPVSKTWLRRKAMQDRAPLKQCLRADSLPCIQRPCGLC